MPCRRRRPAPEAARSDRDARNFCRNFFLRFRLPSSISSSIHPFLHPLIHLLHHFFPSSPPLIHISSSSSFATASSIPPCYLLSLLRIESDRGYPVVSVPFLSQHQFFHTLFAIMLSTRLSRNVSLMNPITFLGYSLNANSSPAPLTGYSRLPNIPLCP